MIMLFKGLGDKAKITAEAPWHRILGLFESRLVMHTFAKKSTGRRDFKDTTTIAVESYKELEAEFGERLTASAPCPWMVIPLASAAAPSTALGGLKTVLRGGEVTKYVVLEMGFGEGKRIRKTDTAKHEVIEYTIDTMRAADCLVSNAKGKQFAVAYQKLAEYDILEIDPLKASER